MGAHLVNGQFQSDKYPTTPPGKVPLSVKDTSAQDLLWEYAQRRRLIDAEFSDDLETALKTAGFDPNAMDADRAERTINAIARAFNWPVKIAAGGQVITGVDWHREQGVDARYGAADAEFPCARTS